MPSRYTDNGTFTGQHIGQIDCAIMAMFPRENLLEEFVDERLGREVSASVPWGSGLSRAAFKLITFMECIGGIGRLLEAMHDHQPENGMVNEVITYLVEAGYLLDTQATMPARTYRRGSWFGDCGWDRFAVGDDARTHLISVLTECFETAASLEGFLIGSFTHDFAREVARKISRNSPIESNLHRVVCEFERMRWLTAFTAAARDAYPTSVRLLEIFLEMKDCNLVPTSYPATKLSVPKPLRVFCTLKKLGKDEKKELIDLLVEAFDMHGLRKIARDDLGERLGTIAAPGALRPTVGRVVEWCIAQYEAVTHLLNGMVKRRPLRSDIRVFVKKLAEKGFIKLT